MHIASFPKAARLLKADEFSAIVRRRPLVRTRHFALYGRRTSEASRLGLVTGRKYARHAATRNTIRRVGRELFRTRRAEFFGWDILIRLQQRLDRRSLVSASSPMLKALCWDEMQALVAQAIKHMARLNQVPHSVREK